MSHAVSELIVDEWEPIRIARPIEIRAELERVATGDTVSVRLVRHGIAGGRVREECDLLQRSRQPLFPVRESPDLLAKLAEVLDAPVVEPAQALFGRRTDEIHADA